MVYEVDLLLKIYLAFDDPFLHLIEHYVILYVLILEVEAKAAVDAGSCGCELEAASFVEWTVGKVALVALICWYHYGNFFISIAKLKVYLWLDNERKRLGSLASEIYAVEDIYLKGVEVSDCELKENRLILHLIKHDLKGNELVRLVYGFSNSKHKIEVLLPMKLDRVQLDRRNLFILIWINLSFDFEGQRNSLWISRREDSHTHLHILPKSDWIRVIIVRMLSVILNEVYDADAVP